MLVKLIKLIRLKIGVQHLKLMNNVDKTLAQLCRLFVKIECYKAARCVYSLFEKRCPRFDKQVMKCRMLLNDVRTKY